MTGRVAHASVCCRGLQPTLEVKSSLHGRRANLACAGKSARPKVGTPAGRSACATAVFLLASMAWAQTTVSPAHIPNTPPAYTDLKFPPLKHIPIPNVATYTLPNGMKLYLLEDHELPVVSGTIRVRTGNLFEPPDKVGLATITGVVMRSGGTKNKTWKTSQRRWRATSANPAAQSPLPV